MTLSISLNGIYPPAPCINETFIRLNCHYDFPDGKREKMISQSFPLECAMRFFRDFHRPDVAKALLRNAQKMRARDFGRELPDFPDFQRSNFLPEDPLFQNPLIVLHGVQFENFSIEAYFKRRGELPQ